MKKILSTLLAVAMIVSMFACFTIESSAAETSESSDYISEEQRLEHINMLIGDNKVIAQNVKHEEYNEKEDINIITYTWEVDPEFATAVGKEGSNITEDGVTVKRGITSMSLLCENSNFALYMDMSAENASDIAVLDKSTGHVYHSDPIIEANSTYANVKVPTVGSAATKQYQVTNPIISPVAIEAYDVSNKRYEFNFRENCLEDLRLEIVQMGEYKFRIIYTIGNDPDKDLVPPVVTEETWAWIEEKLLAHTELNEKGVEIGAQAFKDLDNCYKHVTPTSLELEDRERFIKNYPLLDVTPMYIVRVLNTRQKQIVKEAMTLAGFTVEMLKKEMEAVEYSGPERAVMFTIPVDIELTEEGFQATVDSSLIQAPAKQKIYKISLYRAFGSFTPTSKQNGVPYIITCDGSGAIMPGRGNVTTSVYTDRIYGKDQTFQSEEETTKMMQIISPFLIYDRADVGGIMAILESGSAQAFATARPANAASNPGASVNYDLVYAERDYRTYSGGQSSSSSTSLSSSTSSSGVVLSKEQQVAVFTVKYYFTEGGLTYSDYAKLYREYLIKAGKLTSETVDSSEKTPFYLQAVGAINKNESVAGLPIDATKALTSYTELKEIVSELIAAGVNNINVQYLYWANEGYYNTIANVPSLMSEMGSKSDLSDLISYLNQNDVGFYPSAEFLYVYKDKATDALNYTLDAARRLDMRVARVYDRNLATYQASSSTNVGDYTKTILSPDLIPTMAKSYLAEYNKIISTKTISLGSIGKDINSNYKIGRILNRTQAYDAQIEAIDTFANDGYDMLFSVGNDYTWKYASHIVELPMGSSEYLSTTGSIPFVQMVLHGYIQYASEAFNISADYQTHLLKCLETGSGVIFRWMYDDDGVFDNTDFYQFYSLNYKNSFDRAVALYKEIAAILDKVSGKEITLHETANAYLVYDGEIHTLAEGEEGYVEGQETLSYNRIATTNVFHTVYGNGTVDIYVNYNSFDVELEDRTIVPANGYLEVK